MLLIKPVQIFKKPRLIVFLQSCFFILLFVLIKATHVVTLEQSTHSDFLIEKPVADTYVVSGLEDQSWPTDSKIWIGYSQAGNEFVKRALTKFDLAKIPDQSTITSARLYLFLAGRTPGDLPMSVGVALFPKDWPENITWKQFQNLGGESLISENPIQVGTDFAWYQWDVQALIQRWLSTPKEDRTDYFSIVLIGEVNSGQHERAFWAKDCSDSDCNGNRPRLEIQFSTPTSTPTNTPIPTPTATPTPPFARLTLRNAPTGEVKPNEQIKYTTHYAIGPNEDLNDVKISSTIPNDVKLITTTIKPSKDVTYTGIYAGGIITWTLGNRDRKQEGDVSYTVCRPTAEENKSCTDPIPIDTEAPIIHRGARITWTPKHVSDPGEALSFGARNPPYYLYLPIVAHK